jgi:hypothetical protein
MATPNKGAKCASSCFLLHSINSWDGSQRYGFWSPRVRAAWRRWPIVSRKHLRSMSLYWRTYSPRWRRRMARDNQSDRWFGTTSGCRLEAEEFPCRLRDRFRIIVEFGNLLQRCDFLRRHLDMNTHVSVSAVLRNILPISSSVRQFTLPTRFCCAISAEQRITKAPSIIISFFTVLPSTGQLRSGHRSSPITSCNGLSKPLKSGPSCPGFTAATRASRHPPPSMVIRRGGRPRINSYRYRESLSSAARADRLEYFDS